MVANDESGKMKTIRNKITDLRTCKCLDVEIVGIAPTQLPERCRRILLAKKDMPDIINFISRIIEYTVQ